MRACLLRANSVLELHATAHDGELARFDYVELTESTAQPAPLPTVRLEAESFDDLGSFFVNNSGNASDSELIRLVGSTSGVATTDLGTAGVAAGTYDVTVAYFDENDGVSTASLWLDGVQIGAWAFDDPSGQDAAQATNLRTFTVAGVSVASNSVLELRATAHDGELARIDYVELAPSQTSSATGDPAPAELTLADVLPSTDGTAELSGDWIFDHETGPAGSDHVSDMSAVHDFGMDPGLSELQSLLGVDWNTGDGLLLV